MIYLKTNEELFSKSEIPQKLLSDIVKSISDKYEVKVSRGSKNKNDNIIDRISIKTKTPIGVIDTIITLRKPFDVRSYKKIRALFTESELQFSTYYNKTRYVDSDSKISEWKKIDADSVLHNIDYIIGRVQKEGENKKKVESFYDKISVDEMKDLVADLSDLIGEYKISKSTFSGGKSGFKLEFSVPNKLNSDEIRIYKPNDKFLDIMKELNSLYNRLTNGYNLDMNFSLSSNERDISNKAYLKIIIFEI